MRPLVYVYVMDTGEKSIVAQGLLITGPIFLFPRPRRKVHGFTTLATLFHYSLRHVSRARTLTGCV